MRRIRQHRNGIRLPAFAALLLAVVLLLAHRAGGSEAAERLLDRLAASRDFVSHVFAIETGAQAKPIAIHAPVIPTAAPAPLASETGLPVENAVPLEITEPTVRAQTVAVNNESGLSADVDAMLRAPVAIECTDGAPTVLIYHTHATEAYTPTDADTYTPSGDYRTTDTTKNVVRIGTELKQVLEAQGISVIHLTDLYDHPSYNGSYGASLTAIKKVLEQYPTIQFTIDIHRDAVIRADGSQYRTEAMINGSPIAQLMLVVGTDASGLEHPDWQQNLNFAANLQADLAGPYPDLMRPINLRRQRFNEHLRTGGMLLEVGSSGNTLQEALAAVRLFGEALAARIL